MKEQLWIVVEEIRSGEDAVSSRTYAVGTKREAEAEVARLDRVDRSEREEMLGIKIAYVVQVVPSLTPPSLLKPKSQGEQSRVSERELARRTRGHRQPASGAIDGHKGDVMGYGGLMLIEEKRTKKASISVHRDWLVKIDHEAFSSGKMAGLCLFFEEMPLGTDKRWIAVPLATFDKLVEARLAQKEA